MEKKLLNEEEEIDWAKKCKIISDMMLDNVFTNDEQIIQLISDRFTDKEILFCAHQFIVERTLFIKQKKLDEQKSTDIIYG
jgi:hypothetical protein